MPLTAAPPLATVSTGPTERGAGGKSGSVHAASRRAAIRACSGRTSASRIDCRPAVSGRSLPACRAAWPGACPCGGSRRSAASWSVTSLMARCQRAAATVRLPSPATVAPMPSTRPERPPSDRSGWLQ
eukprot:5157167-Prymnesium_polylepis.1